MDNEVSLLLKDASNILAQLSYAIENENKRICDRLDAMQSESAQNKNALKAVAEAILKAYE